MTLVLGVLLVAAVGLYVGWPVLHRPGAYAPRRERERRPAGDVEREVVMRQLGELEYDFRMGKIGRDDYRQQRAGLLHRI